jgi:hypothetical protein
LGPVNPDAATIERYTALVAQWNKSMGSMWQPMKACLLSLRFRNQGDVVVMQTARYFYCNDPNTVKWQADNDAGWFREHEFAVLRTKVEAKVHACAGLNNDSAGYFESHIKVCSSQGDSEPLGEKECAALDEVASDITKRQHIAVPLSWNRHRHPTGAYQRFLNVRCEQLDQALELVKRVKTDIEASGVLKVLHSADEWVVYDTNRAMDAGWIDFATDEKPPAEIAVV